MNTLRLALLSLIVAGCTTNEQGKKIVDAEAVKNAALLACLIAPSTAQVIKLYTDNKHVDTTEQAARLLCAAASPFIVPEVSK